MLIFKGRYKVHFNNLRDPLVQGCWFMTSSVLIEQGFLDPGVTGVNDLPEQVVVPSMVMRGRRLPTPAPPRQSPREAAALAARVVAYASDPRLSQ